MAASACVAAAKAESMLMRAGEALRGLFPSARAVLEDPEVRARFAHLYIAAGGKESHVAPSWARVLYHWAYPGEGRADGHYYKLEEDGTIVIDHGRAQREASPLAHAPLVKYLKAIEFISPADLAASTLEKAPLRAIVVASGGSGKTTFVCELVKEALEQGLVSSVFVLTGTTTDPWEPLLEYEGVTVELFDGDLDKIDELVLAQKEAVQGGPKVPKDKPWGYGYERPLFILDDLGDKAAMKSGRMGELLDSFFMTARSE